MNPIRSIALICIYLILAVFVMACGRGQKNEIPKQPEAKKNSIIKVAKYDAKAEVDSAENMDDAYATYYVVVADTGVNYYALRNEMLKLNEQLAIPIDTMERYYNEEKNLIALPDDYEDEIYAGEYFPRRYPSNNLSLEYLNIYKSNTTDKTIALVSGIYENEKGADSALAALKNSDSKAFKLKSKIYVGCTH